MCITFINFKIKLLSISKEILTDLFINFIIIASLQITVVMFPELLVRKLQFLNSAAGKVRGKWLRVNHGYSLQLPETLESIKQENK